MRRIIQNPRILAERSLPRFVLATLVAGALVFGVTAVHAKQTPEQKCQVGKNKLAGTYAACRENAEAKRAAKLDLAKYTAALDKCTAKFTAAWQKLENKAVSAGTKCLDGSPTATTFEQLIDDHTTRVAQALAGGALSVGCSTAATATPTAAAPTPTPTPTSSARFVDNGDGTVTDNQTGLQWEKKTTAVGSGQNYADPHDVDNGYTWTASGTPYPPNGTAFTDFLVKLNTVPCFAGHCDWRLPSEEGRNSPLTGAKELESILLAPYVCGTSPCIDSIFGPTVANEFYWSATTYAASPFFAWGVYFHNGGVGTGGKNGAYYVRGVRGGS